MEALTQVFSDCADFSARQLRLGGTGQVVTVCWLEGMAKTERLNDYVFRPLAQDRRLEAARGEAALALRERRPGVTVEAVIPCEEQAARWRERDRERWFSLVERCDNETMLQHHYDRGCMLRRNRYLVDHSAMLIAVYDGMLGGTMYTISYAMKRGLDVVTLDIP